MSAVELVMIILLATVMIAVFMVRDAILDLRDSIDDAVTWCILQEDEEDRDGAAPDVR